MSRITLRSNLASLNAQRRLTESTASLSESFTRLSSGLRINRARDDASGLAISEDLKVDARVFAQGVRNLNDSISLLNIAEGATTELTSILIRQRELATQAANGSLSSKQRDALHEESKALSNEYNRIINSTNFNDLSLIDGSLSDIRAQAGYGENGAVQYSLGEELARAVGTGQYAVNGTYKGVTSSALISVVDFNGDGINDHFYAYGTGIEEFEMFVYNRWGEVVFRSQDLYDGWNGKVRNKEGDNLTKQDVYVWKVKVRNIFGKTHKYIGHVTLTK